MNDCGLCFGCYVVIVVVAHSFSVPCSKKKIHRDARMESLVEVRTGLYAWLGWRFGVLLRVLITR